ncbi:MAG: tail fiber assembly protein [Deltaproteobacteria bacterium]|nr:tail fiber assembly protein [Deltaproteobacteria bacterium]
MNLFHFSPTEPHEYQGYTEAKIDPLETKTQGRTVYLLPANATFKEVLPKKDGFVICYQKDDWLYFEDHRGETIYSKSDATSKVITEIGVIPNGYTSSVPCAFPIWDEKVAIWIEDSETRTSKEAADQSAEQERQKILLKTAAQLSLDKSDITLLRCFENSIVVPEEWRQYRIDLRAIVSEISKVAELPARPEYPKGT